MQKWAAAAQARRDLDRKFAAADLSSVAARPSGGWIRAIRSALGMSQEALAQRLDVTPASISGLEKSERVGTISVGKLATIAAELDCSLVYALVPNSTLAATVDRQALAVAAQEHDYVVNTMRLEDQAPEGAWQEEQLQRAARQVIEQSRLWSTS